MANCCERAVPVDSNTLLGLLVPEYTGSTVLPNFRIGVFTKLQYVTPEKSPEAIIIIIIIIIYCNWVVTL